MQLLGHFARFCKKKSVNQVDGTYEFKLYETRVIHTFEQQDQEEFGILVSTRVWKRGQRKKGLKMKWDATVGGQNFRSICKPGIFHLARVSSSRKQKP